MIEFMREAIDLAVKKMRQGQGGPFGAVIVRHGEIIGRGYNRVTSTNDPTAHAEIVAIREACTSLGDFRLTGCDIYINCEPCPMCLSAIYWADIARIYYAADRQDAADSGFADAEIYMEIGRKPEERRIPAVQMLRIEALATLREWQMKTDKIDY